MRANTTAITGIKFSAPGLTGKGSPQDGKDQQQPRGPLDVPIVPGVALRRKLRVRGLGQRFGNES
jgi:hypothetical protein